MMSSIILMSHDLSQPIIIMALDEIKRHRGLRECPHSVGVLTLKNEQLKALFLMGLPRQEYKCHRPLLVHFRALKQTILEDFRFRKLKAQ